MKSLNQTNELKFIIYKNSRRNQQNRLDFVWGVGAHY